MKEMVGGCCVCSDERGWSENPLVYCDGQNCTVAVHQACYGIVTVPTGPWFCRKCESQERSTRVKCELCPSRDGALKKTDNQGWAHVVCALYIPEVRFGNVTTMEPIILQLIPTERYSKACYICESNGKKNRAITGACMQCNKSGCKQQFHVTCAQGLGLLCEEAGNYLDNVKYCGYCQHHYSKLKKGGNVKTIPPYKPVTHDTSGSDSGSSPEKELKSTTITASASSTSATTIKITTNSTSSTSVPSSSSSSSSSTKQRKSSSTSKQSISSSNSDQTIGNNPTTNSGSGAGTNPNSSSNKTSSSSNSSNSGKDKDKHSKSVSKISSSSKDKEKDSNSSSTSSRDKSSKSKNKDFNDHSNSSVNSMVGTTLASSNVLSTSNAASSGSSANMLGNNASSSSSGKDRDIFGQKFTTSNFVESTVVNSEPVFGSLSDANITNSNQSNKSMTSTSSVAKKRKAESVKTSSSAESAEPNNDTFKDIIKDVSVTLIPLPMEKEESAGNEKSQKRPKTEISPPHPPAEPNIQNVSPNLMQTANIKQQQPTSTKSQQQTSNGSGSNSSIAASSIKIASIKDQEERVRSGSPYTGITTSHAISSTGGSTTPSLFVSVPLSSANVPGLNLSSTTTADILSRSSQNPQSSAVPIEKQSPRIHQNQTGSSIISEHNISNTATSTVTTGNTVVQNQASPSPSHGLTATTTESGNLKISYERQVSRVAQLQEQESIPARRSRTPDSGIYVAANASSSSSINSGSSQGSNKTPNSSSLNNGGLKFSYEPQTTVNSSPIIPTAISPPTIDTSCLPTLKESPLSSPGSEAGSARKRGRKANDIKDVKLFQNGVHATHMLGNSLNPNSSVAQKMTDTLHMEMQDHSVFTQGQENSPQIVGVPFPGKISSSARSSSQQQSSSTNPLTSMLTGAGTSGSNGTLPQSLEQLLERQWEQGSQFLMEQAQHFDIASLLSCLYQLRTENVRLEDHVNSLIARRDHLLAVNARLTLPLTANISQNTELNNIHLNGPTPTDGPASLSTITTTTTTTTTSTSSATLSTTSRTSRTSSQHFNSQQPPTTLPVVENGIDFRHGIHQQATSVPPPPPPPSNPISGSRSGSSSGISGNDRLDRNERNSMISTTSNTSLTIGSSRVMIGGNHDIQTSSYIAGYSTVHQPQLRREDNQGKPS